jgi:hypothetical protein
MVSGWVPAITALAALLGVIVGQFWQARREDKRWKRERGERLEQWQREDRYRFAEYKRELYADFLSGLRRFRGEITVSALHIDQVRASRVESGEPPIENMTEYLLNRGQVDSEAFASLVRALGNLHLVTPESIRLEGQDCFDALVRANSLIIVHQDLQEGTRLSARFSTDALERLMRADLNIE